jgi:outer membrane murein-binding lipoprotein Lpp
MNKKLILSIAAILLITTLLAGCVGKNTSPADSTSDKSVTAYGPDL